MLPLFLFVWWYPSFFFVHLLMFSLLAWIQSSELFNNANTIRHGFTLWKVSLSSNLTLVSTAPLESYSSRYSQFTIFIDSMIQGSWIKAFENENKIFHSALSMSNKNQTKPKKIEQWGFACRWTMVMNHIILLSLPQFIMMCKFQRLSSERCYCSEKSRYAWT